MLPQWRQVFALTFFSWLAIVPGLFKAGTNIVTDTYEQASDRFLESSDLYAYPNGKGDQFKYSPLFAALYRPVAAFPSKPQAIVWGLLNCLFFWWGVSRWVSFSRATPFLLWLALVPCSLELDISLRYQQVNALITGLMLLGLADYRDGKLEKSAGWLVLGTFLKLLPAFFMMALAFAPRKRFLAAVAGFTLLGFCLPAVHMGFVGDWHSHIHWMQVLLSDMGTKGLLDIQTVLSLAGFSNLGWALKWLVLVVSVLVLLGMRPAQSRGFAWGIWYTVGATCLLLVNPRTESPTFVLMAPGYLFLAHEALRFSGWKKWLIVACVLACGFFITASFTDLWPKAVWDPRSLGGATKCFGSLVLWGLVVGLGIEDASPRSKRPS